MACRCGDPQCSCVERCSCVPSLCLCAHCKEIRLKHRDSSSKEVHAPSGSQLELSQDNEIFFKLPQSSNSTDVTEKNNSKFSTEKQSSKIKTSDEKRPVHGAPSQSSTTIYNGRFDYVFSEKVLQIIYQQGLQSLRFRNDMSEVSPILRSRPNTTSCEDKSNQKDPFSIQTPPSIIRKRPQSSSDKETASPTKKNKLQSSERELHYTSVPPDFSFPLPSISTSFPKTFPPMPPIPSTSKGFFSQEEISGESSSDDIDIENGNNRSESTPYDDVNIYVDKCNPMVSSSINASNKPLDFIQSQQEMEGAFSAIEKLKVLTNKLADSTASHPEVEGLALSLLERFQELQRSSTSNQMDNSNSEQTSSTSRGNEKPS